MHLIVIRNEIHERHPEVAASLYRAFNAAKDWAWNKMRFPGTLRYMLPWLPDDIGEIDDLFGGDCWPYGVEPNRPTLEALVRYMADQGLIEAPIPVEKLFVPVAG
jgi:4,5-dihydroxyphthalate decarboxylase